MNYFKKIILILLALALTMFDVTFFAALSIEGASIISSFVLAIIFSIRGKTENMLIYTTSVVVFFAIFSSVSVLAILTVFFIIPALFLLLRKKYLPEPITIFSLPYFIIANLLFEFVFLFQSHDWDIQAINSMGYFILINSVFGALLFFLYKKLTKKFSPKEINI